MGTEIKTIVPRTAKNKEITLSLALEEIRRRQDLSEKGFFNQPVRTWDIEQEIRAINSLTGKPINMQQFLASNKLGIRLDTTYDNIEYDVNGVTPLTLKGIRQLYSSFLYRTNKIREAIRKLYSHSILVPIGVQPFIQTAEWKDLVVNDVSQRNRYYLMDEITLEENSHKEIVIVNPATGKKVVDKASNISVMSRASGTQFHISETTVENAIEAYNISIAITPLMIALFGNSPFFCTVDTGLTSARIEILRQGEQRRAGLPKPATSLEDYYKNQLARGGITFMELSDSANALDLSMSAIHTVTRIIVDTKHRCIRNEFRQIDSQSPSRSIQALLLTLGLIEWFRGKGLPEFSETQDNFYQSVWGYKARFHWFGKEISLQKLGLKFINIALNSLVKIGFGDFAEDFLNSLKMEVKKGESQADTMRTSVKKWVKSGMSQSAAVVRILNEISI